MNAETTITLDQYYAAVVADITAAFPMFETVEFDREDREELPVPACLLEITGFDDAGDADPGTGQWSCDARIELRVVLPFNKAAVKLECRKLATAMAVWLRKRRFKLPGGNGIQALPTGAVEVQSAERDDFDPVLDKFDVWRVDFTQRMHFGASVWANETGVTPANPQASFAPDIGVGNEGDYGREPMTGEIERLLANLIRVGVIAEIDVGEARVKCSVGGLTTDWLPWLTSRAGGTRTWSAPTMGEQVVVLSPCGDPAQAIVLPSVYQDAHPAPANSADMDVVEFPDGTRFEYNAASNTYTQTVAGSGNWTFNCKVANINAATSAKITAPAVTIDAADTTVTGKMTVNGLFTYAAGMKGSGGAGASAQITGGINSTGDVVAGGISLINHGHIEQGDGNRVSNPVA